MAETLDDVIVWRGAGDEAKVTLFVRAAMLIDVTFPGGGRERMTNEIFLKSFTDDFRARCAVAPAETETEFMNRQVQALSDYNPQKYPANAERFKKTKVDIDSVILGEDKHFGMLRVDKDGNLSLDLTAPKTK